MTKADLIDLMARSANITKQQATKAMESFLEGVTYGLASDGEVTIRGFGTFKVKTTEPRTGRNPATGEAIQITARTVVKFKPSKDLLPVKD